MVRCFIHTAHRSVLGRTACVLEHGFIITVPARFKLLILYTRIGSTTVKQEIPRAQALALNS